MPFNPIWSGARKLGGRAQRARQVSASGTPQQSTRTNPRAAAPAKPASFVTSGKVIATESMALGTGIQQGQTFPLPTLHDITSLTLTLSKTAVTGSGTVTLDYANIIDHVIVRNRNGTPYDTIPDPRSEQRRVEPGGVRPGHAVHPADADLATDEPTRRIDGGPGDALYVDRSRPPMHRERRSVGSRSVVQHRRGLRRNGCDRVDGQRPYPSRLR